MKIQWKNIFKSALVSAVIILVFISPIGDYFKVGYLGYPGEGSRITKVDTAIWMFFSVTLLNYLFFFRTRESKNYITEWKRKNKNSTDK